MTSRVLRPRPLGRLRLAESEDASDILDLVNESMAKNFLVQDASNIVYLIDNCVLSICQLDINDVIVGFLAAKDYPLVPSVHPGAWENYIWTKYKCIELNSRNTLFLHLLCWHPSYTRDIVDRMLKSVFMHDPYLQYVAMMKSLVDYPLLVPGQSRCEASFRRVQALERGVPGDRLPVICIADRCEVSPRLRIRRAVEEDNDDIVPIMERHSIRLQQLYGDYYISELISRHPESERILLVCEHKEVAVGVMCLNTQINYEALEESFELSPFAGLRHPNARAVKKTSKDLESTISLSGINVEVHPPSLASDTGSYVKKRNSRVGWTLNGENSVPEQISHYDHQTLLDILLDDEEEEMEFDIVNIDTELLRIPHLTKQDDFMKKRPGSVDDITKLLDGRRRERVVDKDKPQKPTVTAVMPRMPEPLRFTGSPNAFLLEFFAMHPDYDERYGFDMLEAAYELFPNRDYCVVCLPSSFSPFPLLEHFTLVTPYSYRLRFINETLYVAHVNSVRGDIRVRPAEAYDLANLPDVLERAPRVEDLIELFESSLTTNNLDSYVLLSQNQPIGLVILGPFEDGSSIRIQYDLEPEARRSDTDATIIAGVMSPIMEPHGRWYLRDILRQTKYTTLFWICRLFAKGDSSPGRNLMSLASFMMPVRPRRCLSRIGMKTNSELLPKNRLKEMDNEKSIVGDHHIIRNSKSYIFTVTLGGLSFPFALWILERPMTSLPKVLVNNNIVVVGASRTGLAFLETLIMGPTADYLTFTNITLVSEHGLPAVLDCLQAAHTCVPRNGRYTERYLKSVPFHFYVDIMTGVMVNIDRKRKCIYFKGGCVKFYDDLVLTCGQQFQHPDYLKEALERVEETKKGKPCERILMDNPKYEPDRVPMPPYFPENVTLINSLYQANHYLKKTMKMILEAKDTMRSLREDNSIVVYGECIEAYSCIAAVLELGIHPNFVVFVEPFPPDGTAMRVNCFNNETVDERVQSTLDKLGVRVIRQCKLDGWTRLGSRVDTLRLMAPMSFIELPCFALFYYGAKAIDLHAFRALNESGLVYDGGLVVNRTFETNDGCVLGAGTCTTYSRALYAHNESHKYYCSEDVGEALARQFLRKMNPFMMSSSSKSSNAPPDFKQKYSSTLLSESRTSVRSSHLSLTSKTRWQPVLKFDSPIIQSATLPGPLYYMKLRKPGPEVPMAVQLQLPLQGHTLSTDKNGNYFRLQLNCLHQVEAITCLSKDKFNVDVFMRLYGKHEAFFDNLLTRYMMNQIDDLFTYFTQPWMAVLYQEPFDNLMLEMSERELALIYNVIRSKFTRLNDDTGTNKSVTSILRVPSSQLPSCGFKIKECGQNEAIRYEASSFWKSMNGGDMVNSYLARYLRRHVVTNTNYAIPDPSYA